MNRKMDALPQLGLRLLGITVFTQAGIVVTGALVRLTGSGLGCPTWPRCTADSYTPEISQIEGFHKWIEFGNRLLTFVVAIAAIASLVYVIRQKIKGLNIPSRFVFLAAIPFLGTIAQAILGGITVLMKLNPYTVTAHFLLSILIIAIAAQNRVIAQYPNSIAIPKVQALLAKLLVATGFVVIVLGVITTGSGPHAGDDVAVRFTLDVANMVRLHADAVWFFTGLLIANILLARSKALLKIVAVVILQILTGYAQWFSDLPWALVAVHVALAVTLWVFLVKYQKGINRSNYVSQ
jgi:cytochrome c oxidase assembly protein subunit 15